MIEEMKVASGGKVRKIVMQMAFGGVVGAFGAFGAVWLLIQSEVGAVSASQQFALIVALLYVAIGLVVGLGMALPRAGAKMLNFADEEELRDQRRIMAWSAASMVVLGLVLALLALAAPAGPVAPGTAMAFTVLASVAVVWASLRILRQMDELMRAVTRECAEICFYLVLAVAGGWAVLGHLGFLPGMAMLDFITLNFALSLAASFIASGRRGMLKPR